MEHTKEPWPEPQADTLETYTINGVGHFDSQADAERARACVNACAGIEDVSVVPRMAQAIDVVVRHGYKLDLVKTKDGKWMVDGPDGWIKGIWPDPVTALIEADKVFESKKGNNQ